MLRKNQSRINSLTQQKKEKGFEKTLDTIFNIKRHDNDVSLEKLQELMDTACQKDLSQSFDSDNCYESVSQPLKNPGIVLDKLPVTDLNEIGPSQALNLSHTSSEILSGSSSNYSDQLSRYHLRKRPKLNIVTENVALALDRTKTSSRSAAHILAAAASSFGYKLDDLNLSHSSIHRTRMKVRTEVAARLKKNLQVADHLTVHWDGKLLPESGVLKKMERVPVIVSGLNTEQLLNVPKFNKGSAINEAQGIADTIYEWNLNNRIKAMCFDTTPLNTGQKGGVCVLLEKKLGKKLLYFACRHHIFELVLRAVVEIYWPETTGPDMPTYKNFRRIWQEIDQSDFEIGFNDKLIRQVLKEDKDKILEFLQLRLKESQPRDDYKEFLELACIFLGGVPPKGIAFKVPGAVHHARWMAKAIYSLKMFMFKKQLGIQKVEIDGLRQICIFIIRFYVKPWFNAPNAIKAPNQDLTLLQSLIKYRKINAKISGAATSKLCAHLWYISEYLAPLAFFDDMVSNATKLKMIRAIKEREGTHPVPTRVIVKEADYLKVINKDISDFVTKNSLFLFEQYDLPYDFLEVSPGDRSSKIANPGFGDILNKVVVSFVDVGVEGI
ncbi:unnamed protein product [Brassicogethes aeneus]|uniref:Uncharacterized protein n=1 Tax=Brassicogethes aeneus TaxID=1431903 RepID=A0A9P0B5Y1_BRAAE|nr:unnamed protein product [Brassicogethes aeneus]